MLLDVVDQLELDVEQTVFVVDVHARMTAADWDVVDVTTIAAAIFLSKDVGVDCP